MWKNNNKVMIFGVFDNLHDGHKFFINNVLNLYSQLYIVVTPAKTVKRIKGKLPFCSTKKRINILKKEYPNSIIIKGDEDYNLWTPIIIYKPNIIVCGYDQNNLYNTLNKIKNIYNFKLIQIKKSYIGKKLHSRFLNKGV